MIRILWLALLSALLAGCMAAVPMTDLLVGSVGRVVVDKVSGKSEPPVATAPAAPAPAPTAVATQSVTVLDFDVPGDALRARDPELSNLLRKAGELALKYQVPVMLVSNDSDREYLMRELNQAGEPLIMYRLGEYPRITISRNVPAGKGESR